MEGGLGDFRRLGGMLDYNGSGGNGGIDETLGTRNISESFEGSRSEVLHGDIEVNLVL